MDYNNIRIHNVKNIQFNVNQTTYLLDTDMNCV